MRCDYCGAGATHKMMGLGAGDKIIHYTCYGCARVCMPIGNHEDIPPVKIAFGYQAGVGKDTAADYLTGKHGGAIISFAHPLKRILDYAQSECGFPHEKDRKFLQWVGTEWAREKDPNVWVNHAMHAAKFVTSHCFITDTRFPNEIEAARKNGFVTVRILRSSVAKLDHASETSLSDDKWWDYTIINDGTIEEFHFELDNLWAMCLHQ